MPCRINHARLWTGRILLEAASHGPDTFHTFATYTYNDDRLPRNSAGVPTLRKEDGRSLRTYLGEALGSCPRFFWAGEYGDRSGRPHYHAIFFGLRTLQEAAAISEAWNHGFTSVSELTEQRAAYIAAYTLKKQRGSRIEAPASEGRTTNPDDQHASPERLPEYSQQSRRPALADLYLERYLIPHLRSAGGTRWIEANGDVPSVYRLHGKLWPFGDRHRRLMRRGVGLPEKKTDLIRETSLRPAPPEQFPSVEELVGRSNSHASFLARREIFQSRTRRI